MLAGEHTSYLPAWMEGSILASLDAVSRLHERVVKAWDRYHPSCSSRGLIPRPAPMMTTPSFSRIVLSVGTLMVAPAAVAQTAAQPAAAPILSTTSRFSEKTGLELYANLCQACHMQDGKGAVGAGSYPSLVDNKKISNPAATRFMWWSTD